MQTNLEQIKQAVLHLPSEDLKEFNEWCESEKQRNSKEEKEKLKKYK